MFHRILEAFNLNIADQFDYAVLIMRYATLLKMRRIVDYSFIELDKNIRVREFFIQIDLYAQRNTNIQKLKKQKVSCN